MASKEKESRIIQTVVDEDVRAWAEKKAKGEGRTLSNWVARALAGMKAAERS